MEECEECFEMFPSEELIDVGYTMLCELCFERHDPPPPDKREDFHADG